MIINSTLMYFFPSNRYAQPNEPVWDMYRPGNGQPSCLGGILINRPLDYSLANLTPAPNERPAPVRKSSLRFWNPTADSNPPESFGCVQRLTSWMVGSAVHVVDAGGDLLVLKVRHGSRGPGLAQVLRSVICSSMTGLSPTLSSVDSSGRA